MKRDWKKIGLICAGAFLIGIIIGIIGVNGYRALEKKQQKKAQEEADANYDVNACVTLGAYDGITVSLEATEDDIQTEVDSILEDYTTYEQKKGTAQEGDMVYADFEGYVDGKKKDDTCGSDYITIGEGGWLDGFEDAFIGMKTGKTKEFSIDVPDGTYGDDEIDGHTVVFRATLQYICGDAIVPEYNDEFVQSISDYNSVKEYNAYLKKKLEKENEEDKLEFAWTDVLDASTIKKYPKTLLKAAREEVLQGYYDLADLWGISHDEVFQNFGCEDEQDFKDTQLSDLAKDTVKEGLVAEAIAEKENLSYTTEDYESLVQEEYDSNSDSYDSKKAYEKANKNYLERTALMNVVKKWIGEHTTYTK